MRRTVASGGAVALSGAQRSSNIGEPCGRQGSAKDPQQDVVDESGRPSGFSSVSPPFNMECSMLSATSGTAFLFQFATAAPSAIRRLTAHSQACRGCSTTPAVGCLSGSTTQKSAPSTSSTLDATLVLGLRPPHVYTRRAASRRHNLGTLSSASLSSVCQGLSLASLLTMFYAPSMCGCVEKTEAASDRESV